MSYYRASTENNQGWRPGTVLLGNPFSVAHRGPDWKYAVAQRDAAIRAGRQNQAARQRASGRRAEIIDANARGVSLLSGLGINAIDLNGQLVRGAGYVFHFTYSGLGIRPDMGNLTATIAADTNFLSPVPAAETNGVQVAFVYNGQGSSVGNAGREMQNVINNSFGTMGIANGLNFSAAEGGPAVSPTQGVTVYATSPDGTIIQYSDGSIQDTTTGIITNADGTIKMASTTTPGGTPPPPGAGFSLSSLLSGIGIGGAIALGLGAVLVIKSL